jgi:hypothetical protein
VSGGDWIGDFAGGWPDQAPAPVPPPTAAPATARETVEIIVCPACRSRDVRCTRRQATHGAWSCAACFHGWKERPELGRDRAAVV